MPSCVCYAAAARQTVCCMSGMKWSRGVTSIEDCIMLLEYHIHVHTGDSNFRPPDREAVALTIWLASWMRIWVSTGFASDYIVLVKHFLNFFARFENIKNFAFFYKHLFFVQKYFLRSSQHLLQLREKMKNAFYKCAFDLNFAAITGSAFFMLSKKQKSMHPIV